MPSRDSGEVSHRRSVDVQVSRRLLSHRNVESEVLEPQTYRNLGHKRQNAVLARLASAKPAITERRLEKRQEEQYE